MSKEQGCCPWSDVMARRWLHEGWDADKECRSPMRRQSCIRQEQDVVYSLTNG